MSLKILIPQRAIDLMHRSEVKTKLKFSGRYSHYASIVDVNINIDSAYDSISMCVKRIFPLPLA